MRVPDVVRLTFWFIPNDDEPAFGPQDWEHCLTALPQPQSTFGRFAAAAASPYQLSGGRGTWGSLQIFLARSRLISLCRGIVETFLSC